MCSRFTVTSHPDAVRAVFNYHNPADFPPRHAIRPTEPVMIVREGPSAKREMALVRWGFVPHWVKDPDDFPLIINARAETLAEKPSFRTAIAHKRCLIPADAFYEWSGPKGKRQPHLISRAKSESNTATMAFAGLWDHWLGADGSEFESAAIITVAANSLVGAIHDRMPAILPPEDFGAWLNVRDVRAKDALPLLRPAAEDLLHIDDIEKAPAQDKPATKETLEDQGTLF